MDIFIYFFCFFILYYYVHVHTLVHCNWLHIQSTHSTVNSSLKHYQKEFSCENGNSKTTQLLSFQFYYNNN